MAKALALNLNLGQNIEATLNGNTLTLVIDITKDFGKSASGKTSRVATTSGFKRIADSDVSISMNVNRKA